MARQTAPIEVNTFVGGLITDATPLTYPDNSSLDEDNMVLNTEGDRQRRLGMDFEDNHTLITTSQNDRSNLAHTSYRWENAGGDPDKSILVVQFGNEIKFFNLTASTGGISSNLIDTFTLSSASFDSLYDYASIDGFLVVADGEKKIQIFEYDGDADTITKSTDTLKIRDLFGVEDIVSGDNLRDGGNLGIRPSTKTDEHIYNLRNQSWGVPRRDANTETNKDPIETFFTETNTYPSNSDTVTQALYPDANDSDNRTVDRFFPSDLESNPLSSTKAPIGHFIIDALERGNSRETEYTAMENRYNALSITITDLPTDSTPGGASAITEFAGRVWFGGFSGEVTDGDEYSPRMSSFILFSKLVESIADIGRCYQVGDPTSKEEPEILDTDGGFIRLDGAYGINKMVNIAGSLFVFAENGVWQVTGNDRSGFSASGYFVKKISTKGVRGKNTVVQAEESILFWGEDSIYIVSRNQFGDWQVQSISANKIDNFYNNDLNDDQKRFAYGYYDGYDKKVRWIFNNNLSAAGETRELVFDVQLGSFYTNTIYTPAGGSVPKVVGIFESEPFTLESAGETVVVGSDVVQASAVDVVIGVTEQNAATRSISYIAVTDVSGSIQYTFSLYKDVDFLDWVGHDGTGVDAEAYLVTGYTSGGDFQRKKQVLMLTTYLRKTETGYSTDANGDFVPENQSSCKVQFQWNWTNDAASNEWGREFQAYRPKRVEMVDSISDSFATGQRVIVNRSKVRGRGHVFSVKFSTEAGKNLHLYGWSLVAGIQTNV